MTFGKLKARKPSNEAARIPQHIAQEWMGAKRSLLTPQQLTDAARAAMRSI